MTESLWETMHLRLSEASRKFRDNLEITPAEKEFLLQSRARKLAQPDLPDHAEQPVEVVEFRLSNERYAIESTYISEVYPLKSLTPIPGAPAFILGVINVRGQIVSVMDLKIFFQLPQVGLNDLNRVIILKNDEMEIGILAEEVMGALTILPSELQTGLPTLTGVRADFLSGVLPDRLIILDAAKLLGDEKIIVNQSPES